MARRVEDRGGGPRLDHLAALHHGDAVADIADHGQIVADEDAGEAELAPGALEEVQHLRLNRDVECRGRLIEEQETRAQHDGPGDGHPLLLAARELVRIALEQGAREPDGGQGLVEPGRPLGATVDAVHLERRQQDPADGLARVERGAGVLEHGLHGPAQPLERTASQGPDVLAFDEDAAGGGAEQVQRHAQQGRLARSGLADDAQRLALGDLECHVVDGPRLGAAAPQAAAGEAAHEPVHDEEGSCHRPAPASASQQRAAWSSAIGRSPGSTSQRSKRWGQRSAKRQPRCLLPGSGIWPGIA